MFDIDIELFPGESEEEIYQLTVECGRNPETRHTIPGHLDQMEPGPYLEAILSSIDLTRLTGFEVVTFMRAQQRQISYESSRLNRSIVEAAHAADPDSVKRCPIVNEYGLEEIQTALTLTRRKATQILDLALTLDRDFPAVQQAMESGAIDERKAAVIVDSTTHLKPDTAQQVVDKILSVAPNLTTGQIQARLGRLCIQADPEQAQTLFEKSLAERRVVAEPNPEGTAALIISQCSPADVYAARDHINILARRLKTDGEARNIDQLRADIALGLLTGRIESAANVRGSVTMTVDLTTLAELDENPGDLAGFQPIVAEVARKVASEQTRGSWTAVVTDPETGEPLHTVAVRRRPTTAQKRRIKALHPTCVFPGCRMPAFNCDLDHRIDYASGGPTTVDNHAPLCRRHHRAKHQGRWRYRKKDRIGVEWRSPLGHTYRTGRPP
ncbi:MAG: DUF222 domain-containing protein [Acidimicrobiia bacterium]